MLCGIITQPSSPINYRHIEITFVCNNGTDEPTQHSLCGNVLGVLDQEKLLEGLIFTGARSNYLCG